MADRVVHPCQCPDCLSHAALCPARTHPSMREPPSVEAVDEGEGGGGLDRRRRLAITVLARPVPRLPCPEEDQAMPSGPKGATMESAVLTLVAHARHTGTFPTR
jgi:hypothetical protein